MKTLNILFVLLTTGVIGYFGYITFLVNKPAIENFRHKTEFNAELWKNWEESEATASLRWDMVHDLSMQHQLIGMQTQQVIELLGNPSGQSDSALRYYLGMSRHGIDTGSLILIIKENKVVEYRIWHG